MVTALGRELPEVTGRPTSCTLLQEKHPSPRVLVGMQLASLGRQSACGPTVLDHAWWLSGLGGGIQGVNQSCPPGVATAVVYTAKARGGLIICPANSAVVRQGDSGLGAPTTTSKRT